MHTITLEQETCGCGATQLGALERVRYFQRQLLTAEDMIAEQDYFRAKLRRHNRYLHGWGVVCGLTVTPAVVLPELAWQVQISAGYALDQFGNEIYVAEPLFLDLSRCAAGDHTDPCDPRSYHRGSGGAGGVVYVVIRYAECLARPVRAMPPGCGCEDTPCEFSRIRDSFELGCRPEGPPKPTRIPICDLLKTGGPIPCPPDPTDPWIVLAQVSLPPSTQTPIGSPQIDNSVRKLLLRTELLQEQLIECCCQPQPAPPNVADWDPKPTPILTSSPQNVTVTFNKDMLQASITAASFVVRRKGGAAIAGSRVYHPSQRTVVFTPTKSLDLGVYVIHVRGSGTAPVTDLDKLALDGNYDGVAGDDFDREFTIDVETPR